MENVKTELISAEVRKFIESDIKELLNGATIEKIDTAEQAAAAGMMVKSLSAKRKQTEELRVLTKEPHLQAGREIDSYFKAPIEKMMAVEKQVSGKIIDWNRLVEQKRAEQQRLADEVARKEREAIEAKAREQRAKEEAARQEAEKKRQAEERAKLEAENLRIKEEQAKLEAEKKRLAAENEQNAAKKKKLEDEAKAAEKERMELERKAAEQEAAQRKAAEEALKLDSKADAAAAKAGTNEQIASTVVANVVNVSDQKVKGISGTGSFAVEITDKAMLVDYCTKNDKLHFILIDEAALNRMVKVEKENWKMPGTKWIRTTGTRVRA
jgi:chromosome segregation ATPase